MSTLQVQYLDINTLNVATVNVTGGFSGSGSLNITGVANTGNLTVAGTMNVTGNVIKNGVNVLTQAESAQTSSSITIQLSDVNRIMTLNSTSNTVVTIANNSTVPIGVSDKIDIIALSNVLVTFSAASGVTLRSRGGYLKLAGQYSGATLWQRSINEWILTGDLTN